MTDTTGFTAALSKIKEEGSVQEVLDRLLAIFNAVNQMDLDQAKAA